MVGTQTGDDIVVDVKLKENPGISGMLLTLDYNKEVFTVLQIQRGGALSSLNFDKTGEETPFENIRIIYDGDSNDNSIGTLFTIKFKVNENATDGTYKIGLKYSKNKDVVYYQNRDLKTRNLSIDTVEIKLNNSLPVEIETVEHVESQPIRVSTIIIYCVAGVLFAATAVIATIYIIKLKKRHWKKL